MIRFNKNNVIFNFRVAGIVIEDNYVLLHKKESDDFWSIPGGRAELMEKTEDTIIREYKEEIDADISVLRQVWLTEDFFTYKNEDYHEIGFYYLVKLLDDKLKNKNITYEGIEGKEKLIYKWFDINEIYKESIYPVFLKKALSNIPLGIEKIIIKK